ncbi:MAG: DUF368 domain-containing protein [Planctomycetales bacterium]|nr:DUF368 domain-containing protein [Planctomycetales bacterium]
MNKPSLNDLRHVGEGFLMGSADIVPGVSGGTVALIVGIYERLVGAISRFDAHAARLLTTRKWREFAEWIDLRFLIALGAGILTGIASLASLMHYLLEHQRSYTLAVFFGLIAASSWLVARMVQPRDARQKSVAWIAAIGAAFFAYWLVGLPQLQGGDSLLYFFACGLLAICAMILPGISGAYILWMLGAYLPVTGIIKSAVHLEFTGRDLATLTVFSAGCAVGLVGFAKLLRWLLARAHSLTMAVLGGFMLGSLRKMWPFQLPVATTEESSRMTQYANYLPESLGSHELTCLGLGLGALAIVLALEGWAARRS